MLAELDLPSYSDYMIGSSLLHVDPVKEAALDDARAELSAAEDAWKAVTAETETELGRAEQMERRRRLIDDARRLLGRSVSSAAVVAELRAMRVAVGPPAELLADLREALDGGGLAFEDSDLERDELVLVAEAWLEESATASERERALRADLDRRRAERVEVSVALAAGPSDHDAVPDEPGTEEERAERLAAARERRAAAEERHRAHLAVEREIATIAEELAVAVSLERATQEAAADADAAVAAAEWAEADAVAARDAADAARRRAEEAEREAVEALDEQPDGEAQVADGLSDALVDAEAAHAAAVARAAETAAVLAQLDAERQAAEGATLADDDRSPEEPPPPRLSEEVEWYLLARLAAQRSVSLAGSLPLLLDDALADLSPDDVEHVLGRLERMAAAVQVIVVSDDPAAALWADLAGADRAAVVRPEAFRTA